MRAIVLRTHGDPDVLRWEETATPPLGPADVLVRIAATAVNRADVLQRKGLYPDPRRPEVEIPGLEFSGTVADLGERATRWSVGDRVMGITTGGGYAEAIAIHERQLMAVPPALDLIEAGGVPEVFITAWDALFLQGALRKDRWALVHAGASGVGTAAIQIVKALGANIAVTCSAPKAEACRRLGADAVLERSPADWVSAAREAVPDGFEVILDVVGGEEVNRNLTVLAPRGRVVQVGTMGGGRATVDVGALMGKRATWIGTTLRSRREDEKIAVTQRFAAEVLPLFRSGVLHPVIDRRFPITEAAEAHRLMESNANVGKLLLVVDG
jgi:putative PIG3 family NAD(P)H quinone oxidoreductase